MPKNYKIELVLQLSSYVNQPFRTDPCSFRLVDAEELPLQPQTIERLNHWVRQFQACCGDRNFQFCSDDDLNKFDQQGFALWEKVRTELVDSHEVYYYSDRLGSLFKHPEAAKVIRIKLMPDYNCYPIWGIDQIDNINPEDLPLQAQTISSLNAWAEFFDRGLDWHNPAGKSLWSQEDTDYFNQEGLRLWQQLKQELAPVYEVYYFSDRKLSKPEIKPDYMDLD